MTSRPAAALAVVLFALRAALALAAAPAPPRSAAMSPAGCDPTGATEVVSLRAGPRWTRSGPCVLEAPAIGTAFEDFVSIADGRVLSAGTKHQSRAVIVVAFRPSGVLDPTVLGELPLAEDSASRTFGALFHFPGSPNALVQAVHVDAHGTRETELWSVPTKGAKKPRRVYVTTARTMQVWPTLDGGAVLVLLPAEGPGEAVRMSAASSSSMGSGVRGAENLDRGLVRLRREEGDAVLDLRTAAITAAPSLPADAEHVHVAPAGTLRYTLPRATDREDRCAAPLSDLWHLPAPYTGAPERLFEGAASIAHAEHGDTLVAARVRVSPFAALLTDLDGEPWEPCGELDRAPARWLEADLYRVPASGGPVVALGCGTNLGGTFFEPGCEDMATTRAAVERLAVPAPVACPTLEQAADLCLGAISLGDLDAYARCQGSSRPFPDLGSDTILGLVAFYELRAWTLLAATRDVHRTATTEGDEATVTLTIAELPPLSMSFERDGCAWTLAGIGGR